MTFHRGPPVAAEDPRTRPRRWVLSRAAGRYLPGPLTLNFKLLSSALAVLAKLASWRGLLTILSVKLASQP